jgi:hypothetical protein
MLVRDKAGSFVLAMFLKTGDWLRTKLPFFNSIKSLARNGVSRQRLFNNHATSGHRAIASGNNGAMAWAQPFRHIRNLSILNNYLIVWRILFNTEDKSTDVFRRRCQQDWNIKNVTKFLPKFCPRRGLFLSHSWTRNRLNFKKFAMPTRKVHVGQIFLTILS